MKSEGGVDRFEGPGWRLIDRLLGWARAAGLRVIVDMHAAPGGQTGVNHDDGVGFPLTFYVPRHKRLTIALWREIAARYRDETTLIGYDLLNEPISPYSDERYLNPKLEPFYRDIVTAIRSVNKNHVVMLAGGQWSSSFAMFERPFDSNVVYTYHQFWADPTRKSIQRFVDFSNRWQVPLLIGETGEATDDWNDKYRRLHERFGIGWSFWAYKNLDLVLDGGVGCEARGLGAHLRHRRRRHQAGLAEPGAARTRAGDAGRLSGEHPPQEWPHQRELSRLARAGGALACGLSTSSRASASPPRRQVRGAWAAMHSGGWLKL